MDREKAGRKGVQPASVEELLDRAYESEDPEEVAALVEQVLEREPNNPEGLLLLADLTEDREERLAILSGTADAVHALLEETDEEDPDWEDIETLYRGLMQRKAFTLFDLGQDKEALEVVEGLLHRGVDLFEEGEVKALYYRLLIEQGDWARILNEALQDNEHDLGWGYARAFAAFMLSGDDLSAAARMLWDAVIMSPNVPFYMLGYCDEPGEDSPDEELEDFNFAVLYADAPMASRDLHNWFSRGAILFGLLSGRFPEEERDYAMELLEALGGKPDYDRVKGLIRTDNDESILETLSAHHCLARMPQNGGARG